MQFELTDEIRNLIVFAMEDQGNGYLFDSVDKITVIESSIEDIEKIDDERYYKIPTWDSIKGFKLMERFISLLRNPLAREELREFCSPVRVFLEILRMYCTNIQK